MMLLVRMLVGCNLAFNLILSPFFREFIQRIRPGFARYLPKSTWAFRHTWLNRLFEQVSKKVKERHTSWCAQGRLRTLTLDGVKDNDGGKVNNVGDVINGFALFVWSFPAALHETAVVIKCQVIKALRRAKDDIDCPTILNDATVLAKYAGVSSDNTSAMRHGVRQAAAAIPKLIAVGCASHILDLLAEDVAKLTEISDIILMCILLVKVIRTEHLLYHSVKAKHLMGLPHLFVDTRFVYAHETLLDILIRMADILKMIEDDGFVQKYQRFYEIVIQPLFWSKLKAIASLFKPIAKAIPFIGGNASTIDMVYPLYQEGILADISAWCDNVNHTKLFNEQIIIDISTCLSQRWSGVHLSGPTPSAYVGLYTPMIYAAHILNPYLKPTGYSEEHGRPAIEAAFAPWVTSNVEMNALISEFEEYLCETGIWAKELSAIRTQKAELEAEWNDLAKDTMNASTCNTSSIVSKLTLQKQDAFMFWKTSPAAAKCKTPLPEIAMRAVQVVATSVAAERLNKNRKTIYSKLRVQMVHKRVFKCLYCYTNLRFIHDCPEFESTLFADTTWAEQGPNDDEQKEADEQVEMIDNVTMLV